MWKLFEYYRLSDEVIKIIMIVEIGLKILIQLSHPPVIIISFVLVLAERQYLE
jgi:hypothetical protein